jgi:hypothetical protein
MAGYRRAGDEFTNATTKNDQIERQREAYIARNQARSVSDDLGIGSDTSTIFSFDDPDGLNTVFSQSVEVFNALDSGLYIAGSNPDFTGRISQRSEGTVSMYDDLGQQLDKPNKKGFNLASPEIDSLSRGPGVVVVGLDEPLGGENDKLRGFGWNYPGKNEEGTTTLIIGTYFSRHYNSTDVSSEPPVLGESKDFDSDPIDYRQP